MEDKDSIECTPVPGYRKSMRSKYVVLLVNQHRFQRDKYTGDTSIIKESVMKWVKFSTQQITSIWNINEARIVREDNLLMSID